MLSQITVEVLKYERQRQVMVMPVAVVDAADAADAAEVASMVDKVRTASTANCVSFHPGIFLLLGVEAKV